MWQNNGVFSEPQEIEIPKLGIKDVVVNDIKVYGLFNKMSGI